MTLNFSTPPSDREPTELLVPLAFEYLAELNRMGLVEFIESVGTDGFPVLIAVIPHVKLVEGKITEVTEIVGKENPVPTEEKTE